MRITTRDIPDGSQRCFYCDKWVTPSPNNWGMCPEHRQRFLERQAQELQRMLDDLHQYTKDTGDPSGDKYAAMLEREQEMAAKGDWSFLRADPKAELRRIDFDPRTFLRWKDERAFGLYRPSRQTDDQDALVWNESSP